MARTAGGSKNPNLWPSSTPISHHRINTKNAEENSTSQTRSTLFLKGSLSRFKSPSIRRSPVRSLCCHIFFILSVPGSFYSSTAAFPGKTKNTTTWMIFQLTLQVCFFLHYFFQMETGAIGNVLKYFFVSFTIIIKKLPLRRNE